MVEPQTYSISEAHSMGVAKVAREAEEKGLVVLERSGQQVVMILSMTPTGIVRFFELLMRAGREDERMRNDSDFQHYLEFMVHVLERKLGVKLPEPPEREKEIPALESPTPAKRRGRLGGGKRQAAKK